ncbi:hypothetical protein DFH94DRAFT_690420 [Russula ochroleuca]|jgi:hypothetical protein|uniref:Uncharacterized protein n=1 Tax=Russula ochroleuca TaxID=152965 RepID=A0A9P5N1N4_9AGAM|nr:hypothetical protein DFH94DRAFT_690420 [Russula ochroleuca]
MEMLDIWPFFPKDGANACLTQEEGVDNIVSALEHSDRVDMIKLFGPDSLLLERFSAEMQEPFPKLTSLELGSLDNDIASVLPGSFLGGSAPRLRFLRLKLLLFAST